MAIDWTKSMRQTYEVYTVDPKTWLNNRLLDTVTGASITRDIASETIVSGSIDYVGELGEEYVRIYLVAEQDGEVERVPLITMLCQTPSTTYNGKYISTQISGYSPLTELAGEYPPIGFTIPRNYPSWMYKNFPGSGRLITHLDKCIVDYTRAYCRAPVNGFALSSTEYDMDDISLNTFTQDYVAGNEDSWSKVIFDLLEKINYKPMVNPLGEISFYKTPEYRKMQPIWTFDDSNSSILGSDISIERDLYNVPNVVELIMTNVKGRVITASAENRDSGSPISIENRGRRVVKRIVNPETYGKLSASATEEDLLSIAEDLLVQASSLVYTVSYTHGYCPIYVGDCVRIKYPNAGIQDERAYVVSQNISCTTGCQVDETAMFTKSYYSRGDK